MGWPLRPDATRSQIGPESLPRRGECRGASSRPGTRRPSPLRSWIPGLGVRIGLREIVLPLAVLLRPVLRGDEDPIVRELLDERLALLEVLRQQVLRVRGQPGGQVDCLVVAGVEGNQDAGRLLADVLDRVAVS